MGQVSRSSCCLLMPFLPQSLRKAALFGCRTDQSEESKVVTAQQGFTQILVKLVVVGHDKAICLFRKVLHLCRRVIAEPGLYVGRQFRWKLPGAGCQPR